MSILIAAEQACDLDRQIHQEIQNQLPMRFKRLDIRQKEKQLNDMVGDLFKSVFLLDYVSIIGILLP